MPNEPHINLSWRGGPGLTVDDTLHAVQAMKLEILRKGDHALFVNAAGSVKYYPTGSPGERGMESLQGWDLVGVYTRQSKLSQILNDLGV